MRIVLPLGADPKERTETCRSRPLREIVGSATLLVEAGGNVNDADAWGISATVLAAHAGFPDLVEFLLDHGADPNAAAAGFTALHAAIMRRDERMVNALLAHGASPNAPLRT